MEIRRFTEADREALEAVRLPAFGTTATLGGDRVEHPAYERWGLFVDDQLAATATRKPYASWFGGREVPTCGVGGVAAAWNRSAGVGGDAHVEVEDLVWADDAARDSLLWMFGTFSSVTPTVRFDTSGTELTAVLPEHRVRDHRPYDLLVLQPGAIAFPAGPVLTRDYF